MTTRFDSLDGTYSDLVERITQNVLRMTALSSDDRRDLEREVRGDVEEAERIVQQMEFEVRGMPPSHRQAMSRRCQTYREDLRRHKEDMRRGEADGARVELMEMGANGRDRFEATSGTDRLRDGSSKIRMAQQLAAETEERGHSIVTELDGQRATINHARAGLKGTNLGISKANRILQSMARRMRTNKVMMWVILVALVAMIITIIYYKWIK